MTDDGPRIVTMVVGLGHLCLFIMSSSMMSSCCRSMPSGKGLLHVWYLKLNPVITFLLLTHSILHCVDFCCTFGLLGDVTFRLASLLAFCSLMLYIRLCVENTYLVSSKKWEIPQAIRHISNVLMCVGVIISITTNVLMWELDTLWPNIVYQFYVSVVCIPGCVVIIVSYKLIYASIGTTTSNTRLSVLRTNCACAAISSLSYGLGYGSFGLNAIMSNVQEPFIRPRDLKEIKRIHWWWVVTNAISSLMSAIAVYITYHGRTS